MITLEFFSLTTEQRLKKKWSKDDIKTLQTLIREAVYMREGSTTFPPKGFSEDDVRELRTILGNMAQEKYSECSFRTLDLVKEYFYSEIAVCAAAAGIMI